MEFLDRDRHCVAEPSRSTSDSSQSSPEFEMLLEWARFATAEIHGNWSCAAEHRRTLMAKGELENRIREFGHWQESGVFSAREKAALSLSEAISSNSPEGVMDSILKEVRKHFSLDEIIRLSLNILAVNDWIDLRKKSAIRVLVVEDNPADQELLGRQLQQTSIGKQVLFLSDPRVALDLVQGPEFADFRKDLMAIFLDVHMPYMSGIDLLRMIRSVEGFEEFPVVVMTTDPHPDTLVACTELNATALLEKPISKDDFTRVISPLFHQVLPAGC
jgi:CheY-like chemotaxis protein